MSKSICVVGELNVDLIVLGTDVTPEWNREKLVDSCQLALGSSSAITACVLAGLGADVQFISVIGDDEFGRFALREMQQMNVNMERVHIAEGRQTGCTISLSTSKDRALLTAMGTIGDVCPLLVPDASWLDADHIHFGSYYLQHGMRLHWHQLFNKATAAGKSTSFDTGWDPSNDWNTLQIKELQEHTTLFMPSEDEFLNMMKATDLDAGIANLPSKRGLVSIKRGGKASQLINPNGFRTSVRPFDVKPVDTTGAGDSFNAGMIYGYLHGLHNEELLTFANACGAMAVLRVGGASKSPSMNEVVRFIETTALKTVESE